MNFGQAAWSHDLPLPSSGLVAKSLGQCCQCTSLCNSLVPSYSLCNSSYSLCNYSDGKATSYSTPVHLVISLAGNTGEIISTGHREAPVLHGKFKAVGVLGSSRSGRRTGLLFHDHPVKGLSSSVSLTFCTDGNRCNHLPEQIRACSMNRNT